MNAVPKPQSRRQGQRAWTDAQRAEQARQLKSRKIWLKSTGPKTIEGKISSSRNARHADYEHRQAERAEMRHIQTYLRTQKSYTDLLRFFCKQGDRLSTARFNAIESHLFFLENELIDIERQMFGGLTFYQVSGLNNRQNIIPFPLGKPPNEC